MAKKAETKKTENIKAFAVRTDCIDDTVQLSFLNDDSDPFAHIVLSSNTVDALLARLTYLRDQAIGLIPNTTLH